MHFSKGSNRSVNSNFEYFEEKLLKKLRALFSKSMNFVIKLSNVQQVEQTRSNLIKNAENIFCECRVFIFCYLNAIFVGGV